LSLPFVTESRDTKTPDSDASSEVHKISGLDEMESSEIVAESRTSGSTLLSLSRDVVHEINTFICLTIEVPSVEGPIMQEVCGNWDMS